MWRFLFGIGIDCRAIGKCIMWSLKCPLLRSWTPHTTLIHSKSDGGGLRGP